MRRLAVLVSVGLFVGAAGAGVASAQATDAVSVAQALIAAENAHNVAAAVDLFAPGAIVNLPTGALTTRAEIERWQRDLAAGNFRAVITTPVAVTPEVVTFSGTVALDSFTRLGLGALDATWQLTVQLGKVTTFNFAFTPASAARLQAALAGGGAPASPGGASPGQAAGSGSGGGSSSGSAPATASSGRLALTGSDETRTAGVAGIAILLGLLILAIAPRRDEVSGV